MGKGKKDMAWGFLSQVNDTLDTVAIAVGGRSGYGRQFSVARSEILMVRLSDNFFNDINRVSDDNILIKHVVVHPRVMNIADESVTPSSLC